MIKLSGRRDSNPRRRTWKDRTLPTELLPHLQDTILCLFKKWLEDM